MDAGAAAALHREPRRAACGRDVRERPGARGGGRRLDDLRGLYDRLLRAVADSDRRAGDWRLCECTGWPDNDTDRQLVAWCWTTSAARHLVVVNLGDRAAQARVHLPWDDLAGRDCELTDRLSGQRFERAGDELAGQGLYVALDPWSSHFLTFMVVETA